MAGNVTDAQLTPPLVEYAPTLLELLGIAIKYVVAPIVPPATPAHPVGPAGNVPPLVHVVPLIEKPVVLPFPLTATNRPTTCAIPVHVADAGSAADAELNPGVGVDVIFVRSAAPGTRPWLLTKST